MVEPEDDQTIPLEAIQAVILPEPARYDLDTVARLAGIEPEKMRQLWRTMGFPDPAPGEPVAGDADVAVVKWAGRRISDPDEFARTLQILRVFSSSLARMAEVGADDTLDRLARFRAEGMTDDEIAVAMVETSDVPSLEHIIFHLYRLQLMTAFRRRLAVPHSDDLQQELAIGFADLVDFTAVSQELEPSELAALVADFEDRAFSTVAQEGGRVIKTIGDEVMFSTRSPGEAVRIALRLAGDDRRPANTPDVRVGVSFGPVLAQWGDAFGPVVNLASRLVNVALPGTVLVSEAVHDALADEPGLQWRQLRARRLKGIGRVPAWVVRAAS